MTATKNLLITGGAGFIGSHLVDLALEKGHRVVVLDKLTYAGNQENLAQAANQKNFHFVKGDINDRALVTSLLEEHKIDTVFHLAAESHVDKSISGPQAFIETNILGSFTMLEASLGFWLKNEKPSDFRFIHVSTDEVYGQLGPNDAPFCETTPYMPSSPYSASKAASDHLARAWHHTYGLPVIITNCSNNFGPRQHREKLIPTIVATALAGKQIPVYGDGSNIRDWLYVADHAKGLLAAAEKGKLGESYCFGGDNELTNLTIVHQICGLLDKLQPRADKQSYSKQIAFVPDRPGHDWRYAIDFSKASQALGFKPGEAFEQQLETTIISFLDGARETRFQAA